MPVLEAAWEQCFIDLDVSRPPPCAFDELCQRYSEPHRAYHTLQHLEECFAGFALARHLLYAPGAVAFALFYHDAIYDTHASDNEAQSAALASDVLGEYCGFDPGTDDQIVALILATRHDAAPRTADAQGLIDIDLSILGASPARFDEYETQVRQEYGWVEDAAFRAGRSRILAQFLARPAIYGTDFFHERLESNARANLQRSLKALAA